MYLKSYLILVGLALRALAIPVEPTRTLDVEDWSLLHFRRVCTPDKDTCHYSFLISEYAAREPKKCSFTIKADGRPACQTSFSLAKCPEAAEYSINGGWNQLGFVTLSVINDQRHLISWFAYREDTLISGAEAQPQRSKVYLHPIPVKREVSIKGHNESLAGASEWELRNVVRYVVDKETPKETVIFYFSIHSGDVESEYCFLQVPVMQEIGALSKSFFNRGCQTGSKSWLISWGHNEATDEAVMTLVNQSQRKQAWFGFNNVSTQVLLGTNGPNPTKDLPLDI